jgi:D-amino-acid dehydrogenase
MPCIGMASSCADVVHAFGHGHIGLTAGPMTGKLVADLVAGRAPRIDTAPFTARRFRV